MMGAAVATLAAYLALFVGDVAGTPQRVYPVPYQWRRVTGVGVAVALTVGAKLWTRRWPRARDRALVPARALPLGFYLPAERARLRALYRRTAPT